ncbi:hypothetical protein ABC855_g4133 [[Candida] zeylanoides]
MAKKNRHHIVRPPGLPSLPPVEAFQLDTILDHELAAESAAVAEALLRVAANYKKDLKLEIRRNLSAEQKIQHTNIKLAKLAGAVNKRIGHSNRRLERGGPELAAEVAELGRLSQQCSELVGGLGPRLVRLEGLVGGSGGVERWTARIAPAAAEGEGDAEGGAERTTTDAVDVAEDVSAAVDVAEDVSAAVDVSEGVSAAADVSDGVSAAVDVSEGVSAAADVSDGVSAAADVSESVTEPADAVSRVGADAPTSMDEAAFERFMATSIQKYRRLQSQRHRQSFDLPAIAVPELLRPATPTARHPFHTPLTSMGLAVKSSATTESTPQLTHFKKLRINGAPLAARPCECAVAPDPVAVAAAPVTHDDASSGLTSDASSSDDSDATPSLADVYYGSLRRLERLRERRTCDDDAEWERPEQSPTPKHKPSHHTLKPKKSILKFPAEPQDRVRRATRWTEALVTLTRHADAATDRVSVSGVLEEPRAGAGAGARLKEMI